MKFTATALLAMATASQAKVLTPDNWDAETAGKTVFIKFFAPWCGHCKKMAPDWEKLMKDFDGSATQLVAEVDCTADGAPLCEANGVQGFPTLKWGDASSLEDYEGGRDYDDLKKFADENLKPICSPSNIDLCDADKKAEIKKYQDMKAEDLEKFITDKEEALAKLEKDFGTFVEGLQNQYQTEMMKKDAASTKIKKSGLGLAKSVRAAKSKATKEEL